MLPQSTRERRSRAICKLQQPSATQAAARLRPSPTGGLNPLVVERGPSVTGGSMRVASHRICTLRSSRRSRLITSTERRSATVGRRAPPRSRPLDATMQRSHTAWRRSSRRSSIRRCYQSPSFITTTLAPLITAVLARPVVVCEGARGVTACGPMPVRKMWAAGKFACKTLKQP